MENFSSSIRWFELQPKDLKGLSFEVLTERFRWEGIAGLVIHLESLNGVVINLLSPVGSVLQSPTHFGDLFLDLFPNGNNRIDWASNPDRGRAYAQELRRAKIRKADPQARNLFGHFDDVCGSRARSVPSLSTSVGYLEYYRLFSCGFDKIHEPAIRNYLEKLFSQLGHWAFVSFPESQKVTDLEWGKVHFDFLLLSGMPHTIYSEIETLLLRELAPIRLEQTQKQAIRQWESIAATSAFTSQVETQYKGMVGKVIAELKRSVERLEAGMDYDVELAPITRIKALLCISGGDLSEAVYTVEILSYRARLVRLLGWPIYFRKVQQDLPKLREQWPELVDGKSPPYDPIHELECYHAEMLVRFPVLGENPFAVGG
ncbi:MAG: hypothetical protein QG662_421 [Pseudomonadota bacterium]|nr:hypothetical protein [Pseudomonadota bacterium]